MSWAEACGGWVMWAWVKPLPSGAVFWSITPNSFDTKAECEIRGREKRRDNVNETSRKWDEQYICFPGGTDPREKSAQP